MIDLHARRKWSLRPPTMSVEAVAVPRDTLRARATRRRREFLPDPI
jgi:hypothetical protein